MALRVAGPAQRRRADSLSSSSSCSASSRAIGLDQVDPVPRHGARGPLRLAVLLVRERGLGHHRPDPGVVGQVGEVPELLVGDRQLLAQRREPAPDQSQPTLDEEGHELSLRTPQADTGHTRGRGSDDRATTGRVDPARRHPSTGGAHDGHDQWGVADGWWTTDGRWHDVDARDPRRPPPRPGRRPAPRRPAGRPLRRGSCARASSTRLSSPATLELDSDGTARSSVSADASRRPAAGGPPTAPHRRRPDHRAVRGARRRPRARPWAGAGRPSSTRRRSEQSWGHGDLVDLATGRPRGPGTPAARCWRTTRWARRCPPSTSNRRRTTRRPGGSGRRCTCASSRCSEPSSRAERRRARPPRAGQCARTPGPTDRSGPGVGAQARRARGDLGRHRVTPTSLPRRSSTGRVRRRARRGSPRSAPSPSSTARAGRSWPAEHQHPDSTRPSPSSLRRNADRVDFYRWLQIEADAQLGAAAAAGAGADGRPAGRASTPTGFDAWTDQDLLALGCSVGAPPDDFSPIGQDWGLPPYVPWKLRVGRATRRGSTRCAASCATAPRCGWTT